MGSLDGKEGLIEAYAAYAKDHMFVNLAAGYASTDWTFDAPISGSNSATVSGVVASAQAGSVGPWATSAWG